MALKEWFKNRKEEQLNVRNNQDVVIDDSISNLWATCYNCNAQLLRQSLEDNLMVCPHCDYHFRINAETRLKQIIDENTFEELWENMSPADPLSFVDTESYISRQEKAKKKNPDLKEAVITGIGEIKGSKVALGIMDFDYMGGSMGSVVGEKITRLIETAIEKRLPTIIFTSSGGARMQESVISLMQMAKTSCAVSRLAEEKLLYINVLTEPTFGGVTASFGTLGDIIIAEQGARIGFAGRRVIEQTIRQKLPVDFQTAEYLMGFGQIDHISKRKDLKSTLSTLIKMHS